MDKKHITKEMLFEKGMLDVTKYTKQDKSFYKSKEWKRESKKYRKHHPYCEVCLNENIERPSKLVHHITPISQSGDPFDENNLLALCKKCHGEIHAGIGIKIDLDYIENIFKEPSSPEDKWWDSGLHDLYFNKQKEIEALINKARVSENNDMEKSIELYFSSCELIDDFDKILSDDPLLGKAYCQEFGVSTFRTVRYPINRLSLLLEKSKRYTECIQLIQDYQNKDDKCGLTSTDQKAIQKRKDRVIQKIK